MGKQQWIKALKQKVIGLEGVFQPGACVPYFTFNDYKNLKNSLIKLKKFISILHHINIDFIDLK